MSDCDLEKMENMLSQPFETDSGIIKKLRAENKALREKCEGFIQGAVSLTKMVENVRESRDDLLDELKYALFIFQK